MLDDEMPAEVELLLQLERCTDRELGTFLIMNNTNFNPLTPETKDFWFENDHLGRSCYEK